MTACAFAFISCSTLQKKEVFSKLEKIVEDNYGGDQKRSNCMKKHLKDKKKHLNLANNVSSLYSNEEFENFMTPYIDVALKECTAYSWFIFFISAMAILALICLSIFVVDCVYKKSKGEEPRKDEKDKELAV